MNKSILYNNENNFEYILKVLCYARIRTMKPRLITRYIYVFLNDCILAYEDMYAYGCICMHGYICVCMYLCVYI